MRVNSLINFVLVSTATVCLMGVVTTKHQPTRENTNFYKASPSKLVLPPDTPLVEDEPVDLKFKFKDNQGTLPMFDSKSKLYLEDPENIKTEIQYDPKTGNYDIKQKVGDLPYRPESFMSLKEYQEYVARKQMREYWRSRVAADELNERPRQGLIPKLQVNSELFDRIFGGNTVDIKPTGTAELMFGLTHNRMENPAIPQKLQRITNFDFNMRIQLNLLGKIGEKVKVSTNYNTEASFDWENQFKIDYNGLEDEIIKKIEAGNVTLPLNSSLISGSQTLFGFKTELQFGKLKATTVISQQRGKKQEITVQGGAQTTPFSINADNYEQNKHFYLGHYFRKNYDLWMSTLPVINTPIVVNKIEVYLLGINGSAEQTRNILAFEDLGEDIRDVYTGTKALDLIADDKYAITDGVLNDSIPSNNANTLYSIMTNSVDGVLIDRKIDEVSSSLSSTKLTSNINNAGGIYMDGGRDYNILRNARRLNPTEYYFNPRTGYLSLNQQLNNDQSLAVSYQFTYGGKVYQVGEFSEQVSDNNKFIICKLLKSNVVNVKQPTWQLMMKNVYALGAYNLNPQDFKLDVFYNNIETGVDVPYLPVGKPDGKVNGKQLIRVLNCDNLSVNGDKVPDGVYDFIVGYTISQVNGRAYFPTSEPFGRSLAAKFSADEMPEAQKYIFNELYDSTRTAASFLQNKNRFKIKGSYRSSSGSEISLNALNIPQGAVIVTANGLALVENVDYTVEYSMGRVKIINEGILNSGATIKVSLESNSLFMVQQKSLWGTRLDYKAGRDLTLGGTFLRFNEKPLTAKVAMGEEPVSNIIAGFDFNYKADLPLLTRILDKLPFYSTKEMSSITTRGEIAKLFPGNSRAINTNGGNSYIDDYEGSIALIDIRGATSWNLSSIPQGQTKLFKESVFSDSVITGINRARFNWYNVDFLFTRDQGEPTPDHFVTKKLFSNNMWRQVFETELFPGKTPPNGQQVILPTLDLAFFPNQRGPYNYDIKEQKGYSAGINRDGTLKSPESRWGGIMRRLETNDFQAANVEYIQFWLMDPFNEDYNTETDSLFDKTKLPEGDLYINIGNISEDIVKDGRMVYENGIPGQSSFSSNLGVDSTNVSKVPLVPPVINAFSQDNNDRPSQDVGYDGLDDVSEKYFFAKQVAEIQGSDFDQSAPSIQNFISDPSSDRYHFFRGDDFDRMQYNTIRRYAAYNNPEGNSPTEAQYRNLNSGGYPTGATTFPNIEDINRDNTLSESENYYQYRVKISNRDINPQSVGTNFIVDAFDGIAEFTGVTKKVKWYQFKIPVSQFESNIGNIEGFNSIRFMRMFVKGFKVPVVLRLARFELVRSDWRRYQYSLNQAGEYIISDDYNTPFDVSAVSLLENSNKLPVNYVLPPDIEQQQNVQTTNLVLQNEQALQMRICNLKDGDSKAIFKNVDLDTRMFKNIKMNVHAERLNNQPLNDDDLTLFFRVGTDYNNNFYEYEQPLKLTPAGRYDPNNIDSRYAVWPTANEVNLKFEDISLVKAERNTSYESYKNLDALSKPFTKSFGSYSITLVGNPNLGTVKSIMVGVRNRKTGTETNAHCVEVWINELRLTDFNNKGGWATTGQIQAKLADLGMVSFAGTYKSPFWGSVESKIGDRTREKNAIWDVTTSLNAGKFFPNNLKLTLPVFFNYGETRITPLFNPLDPDVELEAIIKSDLDVTTKEKIVDWSRDRTIRKGFNVSNVRIDGLKRPNAKPMPWDISNFSATYAFNELTRSNVNLEYNTNRQYRGNLQYSFSIRKPLTIKPFEKTKIFQKKWFTLIKELNLQLVPNSFASSIDVNRTYSAIKNRDITSFYNTGEGGNSTNDILNPVLVNKNFTMTRNYNFIWNLTKSIKYDYSATNESRIMERPGEVNDANRKSNMDSVIKYFFNGRDSTQKYGGQTITNNIGKYGENTVFRQQMNLNVDIPINKIPLFDFVKNSYRFSGTYTWNRRPFAAEDSLGIGNTIQNTNTHNITGSLDLMKLYNKIPYFRKVNSPKMAAANSKGKTAAAKSASDLNKGEEKAGSGEKEKKNTNAQDFFELLAKTVMMVKNLSVTYQLNGGQALPNFKPNSQYAGMDFANNQAPGFLFTTGLTDENIIRRSIDNNWLTNNANQTTPYTFLKGQTISYRSNIEPHRSLKIELNGNYVKNINTSQFIISDSNDPYNYKGYLINQSPLTTGNFNMTTFTFFKSFQDGNDPVKSKLFDEFLLERQNLSRDLADANAVSTKSITTGVGYDGYSYNQQDVLLGAFYNTYTGRKIDGYNTRRIFPQMPLPNWTVTWDGLGKIPAFKKIFRGITLRHGYRSTYNINNFTNNLQFNQNDPFNQNFRKAVNGVNNGASPDFVSYYEIGSVTLSERYDPLIKFDFQFIKTGWSANMEMKRDKTTSLNLTGFQIIETKGQEYIIGLGYRIDKLKIPKLMIQGRAIESPLQIRADIGFRKNITIIRKIEQDAKFSSSTPTAGADILTLRSSADYQITPSVNLRLYYDWNRNKPQTSNTFPTGNVNAGFSLRINFQ